MKRSMGSGYVDVLNSMFYMSNNKMLFDDAKTSCETILTTIRQQTQGK